MSEASDDEGIVTLKLAKDRLRDAKREDAERNEVDALNHVIKLFEAETLAKKLVKEAQAELELKTLKQYGRLAKDDVQTIVTEDKWGATIERQINNEVTTLGQLLIARLRVLAARYEATVSDIEAQVEELSAKVNVHLAAMGVTV